MLYNRFNISTGFFFILKLLLLEFVNSLNNKWCMSNALESPAAIYLIEISQKHHFDLYLHKYISDDGASTLLE